MTDRPSREAGAITALLAACAIAACGGSSHSISSATKPATAAAATTATAATQPPATTTTTRPRISTAPAPPPRGTPPAPDGLRQTNGYATYELCAGRCSGALPASLRRPLHLPHVPSGAACPSSPTAGTVKPAGSANVALSPFVGSPWRGARVTWSSAPGYGGPVLIRGRRLDRSGAIGFGEGHVPYDELQLLDSGQGASPPPGGRQWLTFTRARGPGCYAYQVDGTNFSEVIVFRASG
jgi:hypothetical protein